MLRCSAVYLTGTYGATGGARVNTLPLPYWTERGELHEEALYQRQGPMPQLDGFSDTADWVNRTPGRKKGQFRTPGNMKGRY